MNILWGYLFSYSYLFGIIFLVGALKKIIGFDLETSRKLIHTFISFTWVILNHYFAQTVHFVIIPLSFVIINWISYKYKVFTMFERTEGGENHMGTVYYAASLTLMAILSLIWPALTIPYGIAVFCLSFGDGAAALFGIHIASPTIVKGKTLIGTVMCVLCAILGIYLLKPFVSIPLSFGQIAVLGLLTGAAELVGHGLDNFSIPAVILLASWGMMA